MSDDFTRKKLDWLDAVRRDPALTTFTKCVAHELATFFNRKTGDAFPSHETIAKRLYASPSGVKKAIRRLERAGYLDVSQGRGRTHTNHYRPRLKKGPSEDRFPNDGSKAKRVLAGREKGPGEDEKGSRLGPRNPSINPLMNPTGADGEADERATAPPEGALARPPKSEQAKAKRADRGNGEAAPSARKQPNPHAERQRAEAEISNVIGWRCLIDLPEGRVDELCRQWIEKKKSADDLRAEFLNGAPAATVTPRADIGEQTDDTELATAARAKRPADCNRTELEAVHAEKARAEKRGVNDKTVGTCNANR